MVVHSITDRKLRHFFLSKLYHFLNTFCNELTLIIEGFDELNSNSLFQATKIYLVTIITPTSKQFWVTKLENESKINVSME